ncbi:hypothetical protein QT711_03120 [Sporosarcina saromensis]|uniref:Uncharacterized protein n=1 Tax=Sporosarcina saromensis TaxID=359365 RepID=A0ABU4G5B7_9BACL|nr:hypothetical protein [Sporosarcina saromensis]MDW0112161.1 hypothetical protein [Sporosarcina saromensis]
MPIKYRKRRKQERLADKKANATPVEKEAKKATPKKKTDKKKGD